MESEFIFVGKDSFQKILTLAEIEFNSKNLVHTQSYMDTFLSSIGCEWVVTEFKPFHPFQPHATYMVLKIHDKKKWTLSRLKYNL